MRSDALVAASQVSLMSQPFHVENLRTPVHAGNKNPLQLDNHTQRSRVNPSPSIPKIVFSECVPSRAARRTRFSPMHCPPAAHCRRLRSLSLRLTRHPAHAFFVAPIASSAAISKTFKVSAHLARSSPAWLCPLKTATSGARSSPAADAPLCLGVSVLACSQARAPYGHRLRARALFPQHEPAAWGT